MKSKAKYKIGDIVYIKDYGNSITYFITNVSRDWQGWKYTLFGGLIVYETHLKRPKELPAS
jgi:hypothetical protein